MAVRLVSRRVVAATMLLAIAMGSGACGAPAASPTPVAGVPLDVTATGGEVPCALGCVAWFLIRDASWRLPASAPGAHPDEDRDGHIPMAVEGGKTVAKGEMAGGPERIEPGAYTFALAYSTVDDSGKAAFTETVYLCAQRVNVPWQATGITVRARFGAGCRIQADVALP